MKNITQEYLKECLDYDPETGVFIWKERPRSHFKTDRAWKTINSRCAGKEAGSIWTDGSRKTEYLRITILNLPRFAHRLVWIYMNGCLPDNDIDHIDGNGLNNKLSNLRDVSTQDNLKNQAMYVNNTSGVVGIYWTKASQKWVARIPHNGKLKYLGSFDDKLEAINARKQAEIEYGYHKNHGRI